MLLVPGIEFKMPGKVGITPHGKGALIVGFMLFQPRHYRPQGAVVDLM